MRLRRSAHIAKPCRQVICYSLLVSWDWILLRVSFLRVEQTAQAFKNVKAILTEAGLTMDNVVKTTVFLADMGDFAAMNEVYAAQFEGTFPARSAVAVKTLPKNALVEVEVIAVL